MKKSILFSAQSIQSWIGAGGKLTDLAGGSEILEQLVGADLCSAMRRCGIPEDARVSAAAGGFELIVAPDIALRFLRLWPLIVRDRAPGLQFGLIVREEGDALDDVGAGLDADAAEREVLAPASPLTDRAQRTGGPATQNEKNSDVPGSSSENLDAALNKKRHVGKSLRFDPTTAEGDLGALQKKFLLDERSDQIVFVKDTDKLASGGSTRYLAYIHADGSGIGAVVSDIRATRPESMAAFSKALDTATQNAARTALEALEPNRLPIRPVVLGGDDLTIILPGDYGLRYSEAFLKAFQSETQGRLGDWLPEDMKDVGLRAGAGIAYVHAHFPAESALRLAEGLCDWAKAQTDRQASALAFHRVTTSGADDYDTIFQKEIQRKKGDDTLWLTAGPYTIDKHNSFCTVPDLQTLLSAAKGLPNGPLREVLSLAHLSRSAAESRFARLCEKSGDPRRGDEAEAMAAFAEALACMGFGEPGAPRIWADWDGITRTPLADLHALLSVEGKNHDESR